MIAERIIFFDGRFFDLKLSDLRLYVVLEDLAGAPDDLYQVLGFSLDGRVFKQVLGHICNCVQWRKVLMLS